MLCDFSHAILITLWRWWSTRNNHHFLQVEVALLWPHSAGSWHHYTSLRSNASILNVSLIRRKPYLSSTKLYLSVRYASLQEARIGDGRTFSHLLDHVASSSNNLYTNGTPLFKMLQLEQNERRILYAKWWNYSSIKSNRSLDIYKWKLNVFQG